MIGIHRWKVTPRTVKCSVRKAGAFALSVAAARVPEKVATDDKRSKTWILPMERYFIYIFGREKWEQPIRRPGHFPISEMLETLEELIAEYSAFQRSRPDLPQGSVPDLSQDELELLVAAFQLHKAEQEVAEQTERSMRPH